MTSATRSCSTKDPLNPVAGALSDLGQIHANGDRWDGLGGGAMFSSNDSRLHTWYRQTAAQGFPRGGAGGQWFQRLPRTRDGRPPPPGSPTHLISTGGGQVYSAGWYDPSNETWRTASDNLLLDSGQLNGRASYTWATLQCSGTPRRCFSVAWIVPAAAPQPGPKPPNSALSLVREVFWCAPLPPSPPPPSSSDIAGRDPEGRGGLIKLPMKELNLLRNGTLFQADTLQLSAGRLFSPE